MFWRQFIWMQASFIKFPWWSIVLIIECTILVWAIDQQKVLGLNWIRLVECVKVCVLTNSHLLVRFSTAAVTLSKGLTSSFCLLHKCIVRAERSKITFDTSSKMQEFAKSMWEVQARFKNSRRNIFCSSKKQETLSTLYIDSRYIELLFHFQERHKILILY